MADRTVVVATELSGPLPNRTRLWEYLENEGTSGGGVLDSLEIQENGTALAVFRHSEDAERVECRDHVLEGVSLVVYPYYDAIPQADAYDNTATLRRPAKPPEPTITERIHIAPGKVRYFEKYPSKQIQRLLKQLDECLFLDNEIVIKGKHDNSKDIISKLKLSFLNINEETFEMNKPQVYTCLTSRRGEEAMRKIEEKFKCTIQTDPGYYTNRDDEEDSAVAKPETKMTLVTGDLSQQEVDVLVSSVTSDLDLASGEVSSVLLRTGGQALQSHCKARYPDGVKYKDVAKADGGKLKCREVFFTCLPNYNQDIQMKTFGSVVYKCLFEATESGYKSIAFPAIGSGSRGYPPQHVAKMMFFKIMQFLSYETSLKDIRVVIPAGNEATIKAFEAENPVFMSRSDDIKDDSDDTGDHPGTVLKDDIRIGTLKIHVKQGEISKEDSKVVVNFVSTAVALNAGCNAGPLLQACGEEVNRQCQLAVNELSKSGVALTTAPNIPAEFIVHIAVDHFQGSLKDMIIACLKAVSDHRMTSLAFPTLWTENDGGKSLRLISKLFIKCLEDSEKKLTTLKDISIVIADETECCLFQSLLEEIILKKRRKEKGRFSYRKREMPSGTPTSGLASKVLPSQPMEEIYIKKSTGSDAEVTVYSENREVLNQAFSEVEAFYKTHYVTKSITSRKLTQLTRDKMTRLKQKLEDVKVYASVTWSTGVVDLEGLADDVMEVETLLQTIT